MAISREEMIEFAKDIVADALSDIEFCDVYENDDILELDPSEDELREIHEIVNQVADELKGGL